MTRASPYDERAYRLAIAAHIQRRDRQAIAHAVAATLAMLDDLGVEPEPETQMLLRQAEDHIGRPPPSPSDHPSVSGYRVLAADRPRRKHSEET